MRQSENDAATIAAEGAAKYGATPAEPIDPALTLTISEAAAQLRVSRATFYRRVLDTKAITPVRLHDHGHPRILRKDLEDYLRRRASAA